MVGTVEPAFHDREMSRRIATGRRELETRIGYEFADKSSLERALTHISALSGKSRTSSYQRLEFLGDHVLGLIVSDMLFRAFPKADEGELSRRLADLVRKEACADVARDIDLGAAIRLGASEANAGGRQRTAILADVCEALVGAVFLDGGYVAATDMVERLWGERLRTPARPLRDPKTVLQEWAQARGLPTPSYREISRSGPHHDPEFLVAVNLPELTPAEGLGRSKRAAEQAAAAAMLSREGVHEDVQNVAAQDNAKDSVKERAEQGIGESSVMESAEEPGKDGARETVRKKRNAKDGNTMDGVKDSLNDGGAVKDGIKAEAAG
jgi:ribonuclease III